MLRQLSKAVAPLKRRIYLMIGRAVLAAVEDGGGRQKVQIKALKGEDKDSVQRMQNYGFTSNPLSGAEGVFACPGGNRSHPIVIVMDDPRYRVKSLQGGEVAVYNHVGVEIRLTKDREVIIKAAEKVRVETPLLECTGEIKDFCDADGKTMRQMREIYDLHTHPENDGGGPTDNPIQKMGV